jgi:hypothetical protein
MIFSSKRLKSIKSMIFIGVIVVIKLSTLPMVYGGAAAMTHVVPNGEGEADVLLT